jgi:hypothetical protein
MPKAPTLFAIAAAGFCAGVVLFIPHGAIANQVIVTAKAKPWPDDILQALIVGRWVVNPKEHYGDTETISRTVEQFNPDGSGTTIFYADSACTKVERTLAFKWRLQKSVLRFDRPASGRGDDGRWIIGPMNMIVNMSAQPITPWYFQVGDDFDRPAPGAILRTRIKSPSCDPAQVQEQQKMAAENPGDDQEIFDFEYVLDLTKGKLDPNYFASDHPYRRADLASAQKEIRSMGAMGGVEFKGREIADGWYIFDVNFQYGKMELRFGPRTPEGKLTGFDYRVLP